MNQFQSLSKSSYFGALRAIGVLLFAAFLFAALPLAARQHGISVSASQGDKSIGLMASAEATAKEVGLPIYPGARPHKDDSKDTPAAQLGLWGGSFGFKIVILKLESDDAPGRVADFYRKPLGKYGTVLNCADPSQGQADKDKKDSSKALDCEADRPEKGELLLKSGTKEMQHLVGIKPNGKGSVFQLVYLEARGSSAK